MKVVVGTDRKGMVSGHFIIIIIKLWTLLFGLF